MIKVLLSAFIAALLTIPASARAALPDVIVTSISYDSQSGIFTSVIKNRGAIATPAGVYIGVGYSVDGVSRAWGIVMGPLATGASVTIGTHTAYMIPAGTHTITALADDVNRFAESREGNNARSKPITVAGSFTPPVLVNPASPMQFGALCDGVTDDSAAFQAALNSGDVMVPAATCLINKTVSIGSSNRRLQCSPGAVLLHTDPYAGNMFLYNPGNGTMTGNSIVNCEFKGTNTIAPQYTGLDKRWLDIPVQTIGEVNNFYLAGNTFSRFFGQSMFQTYAPTNAGSGDIIEYNTFKSCGYYGPVFVAHINGYIRHNTMVDCASGVENDNAAQASGGNIIEYNTLTTVYGYGAPDMAAGTMLTGGAGGGANYGGNIVRNNSVSGTSSGGFQPSHASQIIIGANWGIIPAQYYNNSCTNGCIVVP